MVKLFNSLLFLILFIANQNIEILNILLFEFPVSFVFIILPFWFCFILISAFVEFIVFVLVVITTGRKFFYTKYYQFFIFSFETFPHAVFDYAKASYRDFMLKNRYPFIDKSVSEQYIANKQILFYMWCIKNMIFEDLNLLLNSQAFLFSLRSLISIIYDLILCLVILVKLFVSLVRSTIKVSFGLSIQGFDLILKLVSSPWIVISLFKLNKKSLQISRQGSLFESLNTKLYLMDLTK